MQVFIGEYTIGGGLASTPLASLPQGLLAEGTAMHHAICEDTNRCARVVTTIDSRLPHRMDPAIKTIPVDASDELIPQWLAASADCDAAILIAPEFDRLLYKLVAAFRGFGRNVIAPNANFIDATTDKLQLSQRLLSANVPHPISFGPRQAPQESSATEWILKPNDGCGSLEVQRFGSFTQADNQRRRRTGEWIIQAYHPGQAVSIAAIVTAGGIHWLPACLQKMEPPHFSYHGGQSPLPDALADRAERLAAAAFDAVFDRSSRSNDSSSQVGYVGVDLILANDPRDDVVIEINPRLTTSYVGVRHLMKSNLAATMLGLDAAPPILDPSVSAVRWDAAGRADISPGDSASCHRTQTEVSRSQ
ncbi:ATP-grasp domain-containing protein [Rosistilla oblonga]|uniref:Carbamoyl phosphate synthase-like protein n=1 Tax=Rosistilla oblonga TaxID=2527990 RepID=A0A518IYK9_9BACT|nr:ATP-grasp domain-containing protein [Rosistilla oblonga]QDV58175.1 carbamoyl phosphate synthase-like protein [Rosistilla oblonga]